MKKLLFFLLALSALPVMGQNSQVEMADAFRADGKIYVVVAIVGIILTGLFVYLIQLDRKISKIEKEINIGKK